MTALKAGARLGRYEIVQAVAVGGMAEIYLARTQGPQRFEKYVILKRILPHLSAEPSFVEMFLEEARLAASMSHSNIVHVHDFGEVDGSYFFTMEYVHGEDVRLILKACRKRGTRLAISDAITIVAGVAAGLHYAHDLEDGDGQPLGIVHRDVSPSNILVTYDGTVKIADFGIAKATQRAFATRSGTVKGKVSYMSPEQCEGIPVDRRADVFALSIVLYELTTGHKLFGGENDLAIMRRIIDEDAKPPSTIVPDYPPSLEAIVMRGLARSRDARHASTLELQTDLEQFCRTAGHVVSAPSLARTMIDLFGKRPHPWSGQRHPSVITMEPHPADWDVDSKPTTLVPGNSATSMSAAAGEANAMPPVARSRRTMAILGLAALCAMAIGIALFVKVRSDEEITPDTSPTQNLSVPTVPAPSAPTVTVPTPRAPTVPTPRAPTIPAHTGPNAATASAPTVTPTVPPSTNPAPTVPSTNPAPTVSPTTDSTATVQGTTTVQDTTPSPSVGSPSSTPKPLKKKRVRPPKPAHESRDIDSPFLPK
ncbi:MAG: serine/threonine protein kinase [Kofleriaceae bacterium]